MSLIRGILKRLIQRFVAGVLALLPLIITVGVVVWVAEYVKAICWATRCVGLAFNSYQTKQLRFSSACCWLWA